jgi:hypothetical protein
VCDESVANKKGSVFCDAALILDPSYFLRFAQAFLSLVNRHIQVLDRFCAMAVKLVFSRFQVMLGSVHRFQRFVDVRMRGHRCRGGRSRYRSRHRNSSRWDDPWTDRG